MLTYISLWKKAVVKICDIVTCLDKFGSQIKRTNMGIKITLNMATIQENIVLVQFVPLPKIEVKNNTDTSRFIASLRNLIYNV